MIEETKPILKLNSNGVRVIFLENDTRVRLGIRWLSNVASKIFDHIGVLHMGDTFCLIVVEPPPPDLTSWSTNGLWVLFAVTECVARIICELSKATYMSTRLILGSVAGLE